METRYLRVHTRDGRSYVAPTARQRETLRQSGLAGCAILDGMVSDDGQFLTLVLRGTRTIWTVRLNRAGAIDWRETEPAMPSDLDLPTFDLV